MKKSNISPFLRTLIAASTLSVCAFADNPIIQTWYTSDPAPMVYGDTMFVYTGHDEDGASYYEMNDWKLYSSTDMVNWTDRGTILSYKDFSWSEADAAWASQCIERNGKFYYYVTTIPKTIGARSVGVAVADHPGGPFKDALGKPLLSGSWAYIDPTVYIDDDDQAYLYLGNPTLYYVKLNEDMISYSGNAVGNEMTAAAFGAGSGTATSSYTEGPWFYKRNNLYYMVYAAGGIPEHIAYSTSTSPTGPWTYRGIIMKNQGGSFTNHSGIVDFKNRSFFFYHNGALPGGGGFTRSVAVDEFTYNADGTIPQLDMTTGSIEKPIQNLNPYQRVEAETMAYSVGLKSYQNTSRGIYISKIHNDDFIKIRSVDFGDAGADSFTVAVASSIESSIEIHLDKDSGTLIGTLKVTSTGNTDTWKEISIAVDKPTGVHDVYFIFKGAANTELFNFDYWYFITNAQAIPQGPYADTLQIPGTIEAEDYDVGGQNKAYYDNDTENKGNAYRTDRVDIEGDGTSGYKIDYTEAGEWLEYTVNVTQADIYTYEATISSGSDASSFRLFVDDNAITDTIKVPNTGDWNTYSTITGTTTALTTGPHVLKFAITGSYVNIDKIKFTAGTIHIIQPEAKLVQGPQTFKVYSIQGTFLGSFHTSSFTSLKAELNKSNLNSGVYIVRGKSMNQFIEVKR
jgi:arabinoxylan arabinofuranohydrolase